MLWLSMSPRSPPLRDAGVGILVFAVLLGVMRIQFQPVQLPGYLLVLGYGAVKNSLLPGLGGVAQSAVFGLYLLGLAVATSVLAARLRQRFGPAGPFRYGLAAAFIVVGGVALGVLLIVLVRNFTGNVSPLLLALTVGLVGLWAGLRLATWRNRAENRA